MIKKKLKNINKGIKKNIQSGISRKFTTDKEYNFVLILREKQKNLRNISLT